MASSGSGCGGLAGNGSSASTFAVGTGTGGGTSSSASTFAVGTGTGGGTSLFRPAVTSAYVRVVSALVESAGISDAVTFEE